MTEIERLQSEVERLRKLHPKMGTDRIRVTQDTFRRLPLAIRRWYAERVRLQGDRLPSELAVRCLVNDILSSNVPRGGYRTVDGWKIRPSGHRNASIDHRFYAAPATQQEAV